MFSSSTSDGRNCCCTEKHYRFYNNRLGGFEERTTQGTRRASSPVRKSYRSSNVGYDTRQRFNARDSDTSDISVSVVIVIVLVVVVRSQ